MTEQEKKEWDELYEYVRTEILNYDSDIALPRTMVLRLKGLHDGKFMANKKVKSNGKYSFSVILTTFKVMKYQIIKALKESRRFKDEKHKINYIMAIIENKINDIAIKEKNIKKSKEKVDNVVTNEDKASAKYIKRTEEITNDILNDLW